jgi:hypothetical protein
LWNNDVNYNTKKDIGFVAQELQHVMPELVFKAKETEEALYHVKYHDVIALCLEAIKEQSLIIDSKEEKLEKLEIMAKEKGLF